MKKLLLTLLCSLISFSAVAQQEDLINYIYGKAMIGDLEGLRALVSQGYSLETKDNEGNTPYCLAVFRRNQTALRTLEQAGANVKPRCMKSVPIVTEEMIYEAAHNRNVKQITLWQEYGVPVDLTNRWDGNTALCQAVYEKDCPAIDILLKAGASEYHTCMRQIPQKVRQELDCKPVIIDWERVGLTALGAGLVAGGVAIALSGGGGGGSEPCAINQHWDGEKCITCPGMQCWDGSSCRVAYKGEYTDPVTNRCLQIAPPPYTDGTYTPTSFETAEYEAGKFLGPINASSAYAHGYTGYYVSRDDIFGKLTYGQTSEEGEAQETGSIKSSRPVVAVLSTGTEIANTPKKDGTGNVVKDSQGHTLIERYVNMDLAVENPLRDSEGNIIIDDSGTYVGDGTFIGNLATNTAGALFGYNFDYGYLKPDKDTSGETTVYKGSQERTATETE